MSHVHNSSTKTKPEQSVALTNKNLCNSIVKHNTPKTANLSQLGNVGIPVKVTGTQKSTNEAIYYINSMLSNHKLWEVDYVYHGDKQCEKCMEVMNQSGK